MTRTTEQNVSLLAVLKAVRRHGPVSRSELPALTGLAAGTITKMTADLVARRIVREAQGDMIRLDTEWNSGAQNSATER